MKIFKEGTKGGSRGFFRGRRKMTEQVGEDGNLLAAETKAKILEERRKSDALALLYVTLARQRDAKSKKR